MEVSKLVRELLDQTDVIHCIDPIPLEFGIGDGCSSGRQWVSTGLPVGIYRLRPHTEWRE